MQNACTVMAKGDELKERTKRYALRIIALVEALPDTRTGRVIANQLIRSGTSVGANYRAACRARSLAEFIAKLGIVIEEADESSFWLEIIITRKILKEALVQPLFNETNEILAIMIASVRSSRSNNK